MKRFHIYVSGSVQGVGFRYFVSELANELSLKGWVRNADTRVEIDVEGTDDALAELIRRLQSDRPSSSTVDKIKTDELAPAGFDRFKVETTI